MNYVIEIFEAGKWWDIDQASHFDDALSLASSYCSNHHENSVRIVNPDGEIDKE